MGTPDFALPALKALYKAGHDICAVYTQPPRPAGRGQKPRLSPVHQHAADMGLMVRTPPDFKVVQTQQEFASLRADVAVVVAYGVILPQIILDSPRLGCLNIHASLLPRWRGAAPLQRAILHGDEKSGVCIMQMEAGLDCGAVLHRAETAIKAGETTAVLHDRLAVMGAEAIVYALASLPKLTPLPQVQEGITYAHKIRKQEARIDWQQSALTVSRQIWALSPFPGAWCVADGQRLKLLDAVPIQAQGKAGQVLGGTRIACGTGAIEVTRLQRAGKRPISAIEFLRGTALPSVLE